MVRITLGLGEGLQEQNGETNVIVTLLITKPTSFISFYSCEEVSPKVDGGACQVLLININIFYEKTYSHTSSHIGSFYYFLS